jgi:hypothetical protein
MEIHWEQTKFRYLHGYFASRRVDNLETTFCPILYQCVHLNVVFGLLNIHNYNANIGMSPDYAQTFHTWRVVLIDYLRFYVPLKNFSLIWRRHHCRWRAANFRPVLGAQGLWAGRNYYRATPAVTRDLGFSDLIRRTGPFSTSYDKRGGVEDLFDGVAQCVRWHF